MSEAIPHLEGKRTGRPRGSNGGITKMAREAAIKTGLLPHEWLVRITRIGYFQGGPSTHRALASAFASDSLNVVDHVLLITSSAIFDRSNICL